MCLMGLKVRIRVYSVLFGFESSGPNHFCLNSLPDPVITFITNNYVLYSVQYVWSYSMLSL